MSSQVVKALQRKLPFPSYFMVHVTFWKKRQWAFNQIKNEQVISQDCNKSFILGGLLYFHVEIKSFKYKNLRRFFKVTVDLLLTLQILLYSQLKYINSRLFTLYIYIYSVLRSLEVKFDSCKFYFCFTYRKFGGYMIDKQKDRNR